MQQVAPASDISICHEVNNKLPLFVSPVQNPLAWAADALSLPWEDLDAYWWQSGGEAAGLSKQENHSYCSRVAQHAFALGPSGHIEPDPCVCPICPTCKHNIQADSPEESAKPKPICVAPRASAIKEQDFSEAVAARIEVPQRGTTSSVYEASGPFLQSGTSVIRWTLRAPPVKSIAGFLLYLFQDRKLQPSSFDGYRSAIADKLGNLPITVSKDENLTHLLDSFNRDRPKDWRGIPS